MKTVLLKRVVLFGIIVSFFVLVSTKFHTTVIYLLLPDFGYTASNISVKDTFTSQQVTTNGNYNLKPTGGRNVTEIEKINKQPVQEKFVVDKSSNQTNWTVLMTVNIAFLDFYQNWLWHYQQLHLPGNIPIVVIAEDDELYKKVEALNSQGVTLKKSHFEPIKESLVYDTPLFKKYMSRRAVYIQDYLQKGFDVLHVDVDSVWLKNPFPYLVGDFDIWGQVDKPADIICIGLVAFKSNAKVKSFVQSWINAMQAKTNTKADQDVFNDVLRPEMQLRLKKLPTDEFPSGKLYFDNFNNVTRVKTVVVHNNWVIGHDTKKTRFIKFNLWKV